MALINKPLSSGHSLLPRSDSDIIKGFNYLNGGLNPLVIPSIVRHILEQVSGQTLISCRLVCRLWGEEATELMGTRCKISIQPYSNLDDFIDLVKVHSGSTIAPWNDNATARHDYNGVMMSPKLSLGSLKKFNIKLDTNLGGGKLIEKLYKLFGNKIVCTEISTDVGCSSTIWRIFQRHAFHLRSITLTDAFHVHPTGLQTRFFIHREFFRSGEILLPTVKELYLVQTIEGLSDVVYPTSLNYEEDEDGEDDNEQLEEDIAAAEVFDQDSSSVIQSLAILLLHLLPNLEILQIRNPRNDFGVISALLCEVSSDRNFKSLSPSIKKLNFPLTLNEPEVKALHQKFNWPLQSLQFSIRPGLRFPALYSWLSSLGPSLTNLDLDFVLIPLNTETFPCGVELVNMKTLKFKNYFGSLEFLPCMKNLHTLSLTNVNLSVAFPEEPEGSCEEMKSLEIVSGHSSAGRMSFSHIYKNITEYFPKLLKFRGDYLSDSNLRIVIQHCPLLEELILADSAISDEGLTGIPYSKCRELQTILDHEDDVVDGGNNIANRFKAPCISDLKGLKKLHINSPRISNVSILYGLTNCNNLLELCMSSPLITSQCLLNFLKKVNLKKLRLFLSRSYRISSKDIAVLLTPEEDQPKRRFSLILDGKCNACGVSETD